MNTHVRDNLSALRAGGVAVTSQAANDLVYASSSTQLARIAAAANAVLVTNGSSVPSLSSTLPNAVQDLITRLGTIAAGAAFGTNPAPAGGAVILGIPNSQSMYARNAANGGNVQLIGLDASDIIKIGVDGHVTQFGADIIVPAAGKVRLDGSGSGDTYIRETSANQLDVVAGNVNTLRSTASLISVLTGVDLDVVDYVKVALGSAAHIVSTTSPNTNRIGNTNSNWMSTPNVWFRFKNRATGTVYSVPGYEFP